MNDDTPYIHVVLPDTQAKPGVPLDHLKWISRYIVEKFAGRDNVRIVHLGDHADMPSLSSYDKGKLSAEGKRIKADIDAANEAWDILNSEIVEYNVKRRMYKERQWWPDRHIVLGNHEDRITRAADDNPALAGFLTLDSLNYAEYGWKVHPYLKPLELEGVTYFHFAQQPMTGRPYGGNALTRLKNVGHSFTQGHQQLLDIAIRPVKDHYQRALVAGAAYLHSEGYKGFQGNQHWRGILVKYNVQDGNYDLKEVTLDSLCRRYEGMDLKSFLVKRYGRDTREHTFSED